MTPEELEEAIVRVVRQQGFTIIQTPQKPLSHREYYLAIDGGAFLNLTTMAQALAARLEAE